MDNSNVEHGFLLSDDHYTTLDDPNAGTAASQGTLAFGINDSGQIVGPYRDASDVEHGYLATTTKSASGSFCANTVPIGEGARISSTRLGDSTSNGEMADHLFALIGDESAFGAHSTPQVVAVNPLPSAPVSLQRFDALLSMGGVSRSMAPPQDNGMPDLLLPILF